MSGIMATLREQRWDDHRFYHHSRINQSLHFLSAISFLVGYMLLFYAPAAAALICWLIGMLSRQTGHFFFEPKDYDQVNQATHQYKEDIKIGYNLRRKMVLMAIWALSPLVLWISPSFFGVFQPVVDFDTAVHNLGMLWIAVGVGGLLFRTIHLFFIHDIQTGLVWAIKIITDPFNDFKLYCRAPFYLMRGQFIDPDVGKR